MQLNFEKRLNTLIRDFVNVYKKLAAEFTSYKTLTGKEYELNQLITQRKDEQIEDLNVKMGEYYEALRIPRQHYKFIEKLRYEELMSQRDEIIKKFSKKFGVDREKALSMMVMPDPSLPPEKQMELVTGGKVAVDQLPPPVTSAVAVPSVAQTQAKPAQAEAAKPTQVIAAQGKDLG